MAFKPTDATPLNFITPYSKLFLSHSGYFHVHRDKIHRQSSLLPPIRASITHKTSYKIVPSSTEGAISPISRFCFFNFTS
ncbi:hypothetical protein L1987_09647 [Smallanthus sonchifolius]|uniref:Uncharacterized protein n=1 Tax=Smallanthus sonchifolius TaxID=185202 RepID=A0ACB9JPY6_9ASTR|nr:hypothetical protein L1987_09647 [Smallanthus sonchifolius]